MISPAIFTNVINSYLPEPEASLLNGIIFGVNLKTTKEFYQQLKIVGLLHLVVLSGINITLLAAMVSSVTKYFSKVISTMITILTIILFVIFVGPKAPIIRAAFMGLLTHVAIITGRKNYTLYALFLSLIFILIFWPLWLKTVSLQLSYGATLGIILFGQSNSKNNIVNNLRLTFAAQVFTVPIIFFYFKQVSLISPLANLLVAETIPPLMVFGFLTAILGKINFFLGYIPSLISYGILSYLVWIIETLAKIPYIFLQF
ncbi:MAG: internalization-related competence protein ComEC/Rec2 protein [Candidatus Roizmanbacteria bacterium GW2011_GWC2_34_23]|uniref:Internalization-related competence protein ComEC/Rec2 protein n=1 Tax=Candidatus Roizmanbacteria bacterium GW2011_GWC2_34_23 TaxID=1618484 RepID=A0A0G0DIE5_9BACT|nr:MAG: internalization-related competence protein ComEC/Rec2 protein [Candidatus Roizmanbacteria bacterium GW2011_GWC2_34_23]